MAGSKKLKLFVEGNDGIWYDQGSPPDPIPSKGSYTFNRHGASGDYVVYYKDANDETLRFPGQEEVRQKVWKKEIWVWCKLN